MSEPQLVSLLDGDQLRAMLDDLLVKRLEELGQGLVDALSTKAEQEAELEPTLTVKDVSELLQVDRKTVYRWRQEGHLPPCIEIGGRIRWIRRNFRIWLAERESQVPKSPIAIDFEAQ